MMLVITAPLLKNAANGGNPLVVKIITKLNMYVIGMAFFKPPIKRMSLVPIACIMPPAKRKPRPSKNAWLIMWNRLANQPRSECEVIVQAPPS